MSNSLENLKIGDTLGYNVGRFGGATRKIIITGTTPKFWLAEDSFPMPTQKIRKSDGLVQGKKCVYAWHITEMELAAEKRAIHLEERIAKAKRYLDHYHPRIQGLLSLETMADALEGVLKMVDSKLPAAHIG